MTDRYTIKDAEKSFIRLANAMGKRIATSYDDVGAWRLDYAPVYGGVNVEEIASDGGAITHPMGSPRRTPREFCDAVRFTMDAIRVRERSNG